MVPGSGDHHPLPVPGIRLGVARAAIRYPERRDLVVMEVAQGSAGAAVFTRNAFCAAPVTVARRHLTQATPRYLLINTGNANAGTGGQGIADARAACMALAGLTGCRPEEVLPFSTGVIGEPLPLARLEAGLPQAIADLRADGWQDAAWGIMTTDTRPKAASVRIALDGRAVTVTGIAKGAGMIRPDMATLLAFVATDAGVGKGLLQPILATAVAASFNAITVDGDTSTNDACVLIATGRAGVAIHRRDDGYNALQAAVSDVCLQLAQGIVRDGEGATKFITIAVEQGRDVGECRQVAYTIAHSPLVKTAFFASDPNWGRILAAVGRAGLDALEVERVDIFLDDVCIVRNGGRAADYTESQGQEVMARPEITVRVRLHRGSAAARIWTTDLSFDYVRINAEYRS
ncbi:MAG: bifunctional glutamate N-acetyltransferase/amino-acid acetyltransferase ArgJ [Pseudomonadota bacterium]|nr:bifunctional glutamate N-acetyltransferase/amino-acid acetyltransferase ArgJ [Pseudomonadota bacterium]